MIICNTNDAQEAYQATKEIVSISDDRNNPSLIIYSCEELVLLHGKIALFDKEEVNRRGISTFQVYQNGGSILCFPGDINLVQYAYGSNQWAANCLKCLSYEINKRGCYSSIIKNDLLADGKKVASYSEYKNKNGWLYSGIHFSINMDSELVETICIKKSSKIPMGLSSLGMTRNDILSALIENNLIPKGGLLC